MRWQEREREREAREEARRGLGERKVTARTRRERVGGEDEATARFWGGEDVARDFERKKLERCGRKWLSRVWVLEKMRKKLKTAFYSENLKNLAAAKICLRRGETVLQRLQFPL